MTQQANDIKRAAALDAIKANGAVTFADRLYAVMIHQEHTQSSLARLVWGEKMNSKGNMVAKNREQVRNYLVSGRIPRKKALDQMAEAMFVEPSDLLPDSGLTNPVFNLPANDLEIKALPGTSDLIVRMHRQMSIDQWSAISKILNNET